ncbi:MAG: 6-phosphofructokinase, partial [Bdellovibrionaceae bacterium]|nr:6-phosphofructokinase [Pseudobdellovibrionaceae bacterium]
MRIGLLTGGGDAPGLNGVIEATSRSLLLNKVKVLGICDGFEGVFKNNVIDINLRNIQGIHSQAGTFIGTSNRSGIEGKEKEFLKKYKDLKLDGLIVAGGDGTFRCLEPVSDKIKIIGVPKTIDNDLSGTEATFGYDTACSVVCDAVDSLRATAQAHKRVIVVEVMGRTAGWIAVGGGIASYADAIFIPELKFDGKKFKKFLEDKKKTERGLVLVASEGVSLDGPLQRKKDKSGVSDIVHDYGIGYRLSKWIEKEVDWESRSVVLGHLQRSRTPTTTDRFLTTAMGLKAAKLALDGKW